MIKSKTWLTWKCTGLQPTGLEFRLKQWKQCGHATWLTFCLIVGHDNFAVQIAAIIQYDVHIRFKWNRKKIWKKMLLDDAFCRKQRLFGWVRDVKHTKRYLFVRRTSLWTYPIDFDFFFVFPLVLQSESIHSAFNCDLLKPFQWDNIEISAITSLKTVEKSLSFRRIYSLLIITNGLKLKK